MKFELWPEFEYISGKEIARLQREEGQVVLIAGGNNPKVEVFVRENRPVEFLFMLDREIEDECVLEQDGKYFVSSENIDEFAERHEFELVPVRGDYPVLKMQIIT